jgi:uncharacterized membrane protein
MPLKFFPKKGEVYFSADVPPCDEEYDNPEFVKWIKHIKRSTREKGAIKRRARKRLLETQEMLRNRHQVRYEPIRRSEPELTETQKRMAEKYHKMLGEPC